MNESFSLFDIELLRRQQELTELRQSGGGFPAGWEDTRDKRIAMASKDFFSFAKAYFPEKHFEFPFNEHHRWLIAQALRTDRSFSMIAAQRDFGKTRIFRAFKIWCACFGKKHFYGKVSDTIDLVEKDFKFVRLELSMNPKIVSDFGETIDPKWNSTHSFRVTRHKHNPHGTLFAAYSTTVTARGELADTRLDFLEFDDFEDFSTSVNPEISKRKLEIIERDFLPSLASQGSAIMLGNNARTTGIFNLLKEMPEAERKLSHPAVELTVIPAWQQKKIYRGLKLIAEGRPTWHERWQFKTEEEMRIALKVSHSVWQGEYQQNPAPPEGDRFKRSDYRTYKDLPPDVRGLIMCDPAYGTKACFKAAAVLLFSAKTRRFYSPECFVRQCGWEEYFLGMYALYDRYRPYISFVGWESNFHQAQFLDFQRLFASTASRPRLPIRCIAVEGAKDWRIEKLETPYSMGDILFSEDFLSSRDGTEAIAQLIGFGSYPHVDFADALATAYAQCWSFAASTFGEGTEYLSGERRRYADRF